MSLSISPNVNIDTLKSLEANKTYFLSSTTGEVKEASWWMRFKCAIGVQSARQKVANLIDAVRTTLLDAAGKTGGDVTLDTNINSIKRTEMVKGSVIKDIATRFAAANAKTIVKSDASKIAAGFAETFATKSQLLRQKDVDAKAFSIILNHAFKEVVDGELPMENGLDDNLALDETKFRSALDDAAYRVSNLVDEVARSGKVKGADLDKHYAKHIIDTLFNKDGTRNERPVTDLKSPIEVKVDVAFKVGQKRIDASPQKTYDALVKAKVDPQQKVAQILSFCGGNKELEDYVLEVAPWLCVDSNGALRPDDVIKSKIAAIKENLEELNSLPTPYSGAAAQIKNSLALLESSALQKGTLNTIAKTIEQCQFTKLSTLNFRSSASDIFKAMDELRLAIHSVIKETDVEGKAAAHGEDVGGPHGVAIKNIAMTLILRKLGPDVAAKLTHTLSGEEAKLMRSISDEILARLRGDDPNIIDSDGNNLARLKAMDIIEDTNNMGYSLCEALSFGRDKPLDYKSRVEFDIDGGQSEDIRLLVGDMARREIQQD